MRFEYPGVNSKEKAPSQNQERPISPSNYGFVGQFEKGPVGDPVIVQNGGELENIYGDGGKLAKILTDFSFEEGLQNAFVVREAADDAQRASASLTGHNQESFELSTSDESGNTLSIEENLAQQYIAPGTFRIFFVDQEEVTGEDQGILTSSSETSYSFGLPGLLLSGSVTIEYLDDTGNVQETFTDGGSGSLSSSAGGTGTIDYETGEVSLTLGSTPLDGGRFETDYTVEPITLVRGEAFVESVAGAEVYHGRLDENWVRLDTVEFSWTDTDGVSHTATSDSNGEITGDGTGEVQRDGTVRLDVGDNTVESGGTIDVDYNVDKFFVATDDGNGSVTNESPFGALNSNGTIDYETGKIDLDTKTLVDSDADGLTAYVTYEHEEHRFRSINPGAGTNDFRISVVPNPRFQDAQNGTYDFFRLFLEEQEGDEFEVINEFNQVNLDDVASGKHISKIINDPIDGSNVIEVVEPIEEFIPDNLTGEKVTGAQIHTGEGTNRQFTAKLDVFESEIIAGTVVIEYESGNNTREITDDFNGGLEGDVLSGSIDYETGELVVEPSESVKAGSVVTVEYVTDVPANEDSVDFDGGQDGSGITRNQVSAPGLEDKKRGIYALEAYGEEQMLLGVPEFASDAQVTLELVDYAESRKNAQVLATPPQGYSARQAKRWVSRTLNVDSDRLVVVWPWYNVADPQTGNTLTVPFISHYAGLAASTDQAVGPRQVPAGTNYGNPDTGRGPAQSVDERDVVTVRDAQINPIHAPNNREDPVVWGAFTQYPKETAPEDGKYAYVNGRRVTDAIRTQITFALYDLIFRNANLNTVNRAREIAFGILREFYSKGALAGRTEEEAFFLIADGSNNPQDQLQGDGLIRVDYGVAPQRPTEFINQTITRQLL